MVVTQNELVNDHGVGNITIDEKMEFAHQCGTSAHLVARQIIDPNSIAGNLCTWYTWLFDRVHYLPDLMALQPAEMTGKTNDLFILGWLLTGKEKYVDKLLGCLDTQAHVLASDSGSWVISSLRSQYPSFRSIVDKRITIN